MNSIVHFEVIASNPDKAMKFYKNVFGWSFKRMGDMDYWIINTKGKVDGGLTRRVGLFKKKGGFSSFVCTVEVKDIEATAKKVKKAYSLESKENG